MRCVVWCIEKRPNPCISIPFASVEKGKKRKMQPPSLQSESIQAIIQRASPAISEILLDSTTPPVNSTSSIDWMALGLWAAWAVLLGIEIEIKQLWDIWRNPQKQAINDDLDR